MGQVSIVTPPPPPKKTLKYLFSKGPSIIFIIYAYDNFYHKRGRGLKNDDKYHNFFMVQITWKSKKKRHEGDYGKW